MGKLAKILELRQEREQLIVANTELVSANKALYMELHNMKTASTSDVQPVIPIQATIQSIVAQNVMAMDQAGEQFSVQDLEILVHVGLKTKELVD